MPKSVYVVGGGPSLSAFNFACLYDKDVIAINQAIFHIPTAKHFCSMDYTWLRKSGIQLAGTPDGPLADYFTSIPAKKTFVLGLQPQDKEKKSPKHFIDTRYNLHYFLECFDRVVEVGGYGGIGWEWDDFRCGSESGFSGLQLACLEGYDEINLLGFDFHSGDRTTHFHQDYPKILPGTFQEKLDQYLAPYENTLRLLRERSITVCSYSKNSRLNQWIPFKALETII